jgi:hypothetical protein
VCGQEIDTFSRLIRRSFCEKVSLFMVALV